MIYQDFQNPWGRFYNADCFDVMQQIPDNAFDLCVTSPPYDNMRNYNESLDWSFDKFKIIAKEITRVIKEGGVIVWNVGDETINGSETGTSFKQALYFKEECNLKLHDTMIWNKDCFSAVGALQTRYAPVFEYMFVFVKGKLSTFNPIKDKPNKWAGTKNHGTVRIDNDKFKPVSNNKIINEFGQRYNIWNIFPQRQKGENKHPAPFPIQIPQDHIISWTNENEIIFDPFGGSGTTAIASINTKRRWVCIEKEPKYYQIAINRIKEHW